MATSISHSMNRVGQYQLMMVRRDLDGLDTVSSVRHVGRLRDLAFGLKQSEGIRRAIRLGDELFGRNLSPKEDACVHYLQATSWEKLRMLKTEASNSSVWLWEQPELEKELWHLRRALNRDALKDLSTRHVSKVLTNMASLLNHAGRFCEAQEMWDRAIAFMPSYAIARGKRGYALTHYAHVLYERGHIDRLLKKARTDLDSALAAELSTQARGQFQARLGWVDTNFPTLRKSKDLSLFTYTQGVTEAEVTYRKWCLEQRLFLNPLNDLGPYPAGMRDVVNVPPVVAGSRDSVFFHGLFNQMKQAYVSARYLYYESISSEGPHFSDRDVLLFDTLDYPSYSLAVEKAKAAFNMAYGLLDRVALFVDRQMSLGVPEDELSLRTIWYVDRKRENGLREEFRQRRNWPMRGLFWLSKDIYEDRDGFEETLEPDAREVSDARREIERGYLKLHEAVPGGQKPGAPLPPRFADSLAYSMHRGEFEAKTLRLLKRVRSALMYLSLAVHYEEKLKARQLAGGENLPALSLSVLDDGWKV